MNLGVYITAKDDDQFIADVIRPVLGVFPQAKAIDLGSRDHTIREMRSTGITVLEMPVEHGRDYTVLKNKMSKKHDWVFWVDSDEVYPLPCLERMKAFINIRADFPDKHPQTVRISWKMIKKEKNRYFVSNETKVNGHKAHESKRYEYGRAWPLEVLRGDESAKEPAEFNGIWCWHAVLLQRSSLPEPTARMKKRISKVDPYNQEFTWTQVEELPWQQL